MTFSTEVIERPHAKKRLARPVSVREQKALRSEFSAYSAPTYGCDRCHFLLLLRFFLLHSFKYSDSPSLAIEAL